MFQAESLIFLLVKVALRQPVGAEGTVLKSSGWPLKERDAYLVLPRRLGVGVANSHDLCAVRLEAMEAPSSNPLLLIMSLSIYRAYLYRKCPM